MESMRGVVEDQAVGTYMNSLRFKNPPEILFSDVSGRSDVSKDWSDDLVRACLTLYLQLLSIKNSLIHEYVTHFLIINILYMHKLTCRTRVIIITLLFQTCQNLC